MGCEEKEVCCVSGGGEVNAFGFTLAGVEVIVGSDGAGDMDEMLARPEMLEPCVALTGFGAANCVAAETLVVVCGGGRIPETEVAAVVVDGSGVAEMKSSKSSSSLRIDRIPAEGGTLMDSSSPNSKRSTSGSFFFGSSTFRRADEAVAVVALCLEDAGGLDGSSPSSYSSNLSRRPLSLKELVFPPNPPPSP